MASWFFVGLLWTGTSSVKFGSSLYGFSVDTVSVVSFVNVSFVATNVSLLQTDLSTLCLLSPTVVVCLPLSSNFGAVNYGAPWFFVSSLDVFVFSSSGALLN